MIGESSPAFAARATGSRGLLMRTTRDLRVVQIHYSGIVVVADRLHVADCQRSLEDLPGVEVHYCQPETGRLVIVQETLSAEEQERGLREIQALPWVQAAALVEHRIDQDDFDDAGRDPGGSAEPIEPNEGGRQ